MRAAEQIVSVRPIFTAGRLPRGFALPQNAEGVNTFLAELPTLVGVANQAEAKAADAVARAVGAPVSNPRAEGGRGPPITAM